MKINIVLPFMSKKAVGGIKIMYQYADLLSKRGHDVILYHANILSNAPKKHLNFFRALRNKITVKNAYPAWYCLDKNIESRLISKIKDSAIEDADIILSTMYAAALDVFTLSVSKGKKINVIQDFETWITGEAELIKSYQLPIKHIVINDYLYSIVEKYSPIKPFLIYNAIDTQKFYIKNDISKRNPHSVCMMFSQEKRKGSKYGVESLNICKNKFSDLQATLFSVFPKPNNLPEWINFVQSPSNLIDIYNNAAIFITPSLGEGWALPPAEAMQCGCALVCTDIGGHAAYAKHNQTALLSKCENAMDMAENIIFLLENNEKRIQMATTGNQHINTFTWEDVAAKLEKSFE